MTALYHRLTAQEVTERSIEELREAETVEKGRKVKKREKEEGKKGGRKGRVKAAVCPCGRDHCGLTGFTDRPGDTSRSLG